MPVKQYRDLLNQHGFSKNQKSMLKSPAFQVGHTGTVTFLIQAIDNKERFLL